jgi:hypothetical protein
MCVPPLRGSLGGSEIVRREGGAFLRGRWSEARRGREGFDGTGKIQRACELDRRLRGGRRGDGHEWGKNKSDGGDSRTIGIMAAGQGAGHHAGLVMAAIHVIRGGSGRFVMMMLRNAALIRSAAGGLIGGPSGAGEGGVEQDDD